VAAAGWAVVAVTGRCARVPAAAGCAGGLASSAGVRGGRRSPPAARRAAARPRHSRRLGHRVPGAVEWLAPGGPRVPGAARDGLQLAGPCSPDTLGMVGPARTPPGGRWGVLVRPYVSGVDDAERPES